MPTRPGTDPRQEDRLPGSPARWRSMDRPGADPEEDGVERVEGTRPATMSTSAPSASRGPSSVATAGIPPE